MLVERGLAAELAMSRVFVAQQQSGDSAGERSARRICELVLATLCAFMAQVKLSDLLTDGLLAHLCTLLTDPQLKFIAAETLLAFASRKVRALWPRARSFATDS